MYGPESSGKNTFSLHAIAESNNKDIIYEIQEKILKKCKSELFWNFISEKKELISEIEMILKYKKENEKDTLLHSDSFDENNIFDYKGTIFTAF